MGTAIRNRTVNLAPASLLALAISLFPTVAAAFDGAPGPGARGRDMTPGAMRQGHKDYVDIMDDVDAVIDAVDESMGKSAPSANLSPPNEFVDSSGRKQHPVIEQGPRTPSPIVVELFTAQGCDTCPPAEDMLGDLQARPDVLVLSWHVDYWDYLGWTDSFARPEFSQRQKGYNLSRGARSLFTPQMIVAGEVPLDEPNPAALMTAVKHERAEGDHVAISRRDKDGRSEIELTPLTALPGEIAVQLIRYLPARTVDIAGGENVGRHLNMHNIVVSNEILARWDGRTPLRMTVTLGAGPSKDLPPDTRHAIIVQQMQGQRPGEIFATIRLD